MVLARKSLFLNVLPKYNKVGWDYLKQLKPEDNLLFGGKIFQLCKVIRDKSTEQIIYQLLFSLTVNFCSLGWIMFLVVKARSLTPQWGERWTRKKVHQRS